MERRRAFCTPCPRIAERFKGSLGRRSEGAKERRSASSGSFCVFVLTCVGPLASSPARPFPPQSPPPNSLLLHSTAHWPARGSIKLAGGIWSSGRCASEHLLTALQGHASLYISLRPLQA